jgi:hypothetical protein
MLGKGARVSEGKWFLDVMKRRRAYCEMKKEIELGVMGLSPRKSYGIHSILHKNQRKPFPVDYCNKIITFFTQVSRLQRHFLSTNPFLFQCPGFDRFYISATLSHYNTL